MVTPTEYLEQELHELSKIREKLTEKAEKEPTTSVINLVLDVSEQMRRTVETINITYKNRSV